MDRRHFLAALAAGAIVTAEGLWIPGQKLISIPHVGNRLVTWDETASKILILLKDRMYIFGPRTIEVWDGDQYPVVPFRP